MDIQWQESKDYDAWLMWSLTDRCNLDCAYCCTVCLDKKTATLPKINISSLLTTLEKTNKIFQITFVGGGEPFLVPNLIEACTAITQKHYISFITNLTGARVKEFAGEINPQRVVRIQASLHIKELERHRLLDAYIQNFLLLKEKGYNIQAKAVAYPSLVQDVKQYREFFRKNGIELKFVPFFGEYRRGKYPFAYTDRELEIFHFGNGNGLDMGKHHQYKKACNAGYNAGIVRPNGVIHRCDLIKEKIGNIYNNIAFKNNLVICPLKFCGCPIKTLDSSLFQKAVRECKVDSQGLSSCSLFFLQGYEKVDEGFGLLGFFLQRHCPSLYSYCKHILNHVKNTFINKKLFWSAYKFCNHGQFIKNGR